MLQIRDDKGNELYQNNNFGVFNLKRNEYHVYIYNHQQNVFKAWMTNMNIFLLLVPMDEESIRQLNVEIINHDTSKFSEEEFEPYRKNFFPVSDKEKENNKGDFDMAWEHHYKNNPHHWNYWVDENGVAKEIDEINIIHMICDWMAMGMQFNNTAAEYYFKNKNKINLHPVTREKVEYILSRMD